MAGDGPTTAGSIVGKLKMDRDQWNRMKAATLADIAALESMDPKVLVKMNARDAIVELDKVAAGTEKVTQKTKQLGDEEDRTTAKKIKANEANRTTVTRVGAITTAVALLLPLMAPVGAAAVGMAGAFLGMGAAGVFALVGINREMKQGTELGRQYSTEVASMKGALSQLSSTAALNMLSSFRRVVAETNADLPFLNQQVGTFSQLLGRSGANFFTGVLTSLRVMNPLLLTAGVWVERLSEGFARWTSNGGLERFTGYALTALPQVVELLGALGTMVMHVLTALAPLGSVGMAVLTGIAEGINAIPVELLGTLIGMVTWGAIAFKAWGFIAPMLAGVATSMGAVGAATTIATGPIGWIVAGVAALASVLAIATATTNGAATAVHNYTTAVEADTGAIEENVRAKAAQQLLDGGALDAAKKLGISAELVTRATLGEADAVRQLAGALEVGTNGSKLQKEQLDATGLGLVDYGLAVQTVKQAVDEQSGGIRGAVEDYKTLQEALGETTLQTEYQRNAMETAAASAGVSVAAYEAVDGSQGDLAFQTEKATAQMYLQNDAAGLLRAALDLLNGKQLDAAEAQNRFEQQLVSLPEYTDAAAASLAGMSETAVTNRGNLLGLIESSQLSAQAFRDQGLSAEETRVKMLEQRQAIIDNAVANGANREEVTKYVEELYKVPASLPPTQLEVDTARARGQIDLFIAQVNARVATIQVRATMPDLNGAASGSGRPGVAMGGTIPGLAGGGSGGTVFGRGTAGSDTAGMFRLARGEEVVSNVFGQADRHRGLLKQINAGVVAPAGYARSSDSVAPTVMQPPPQIVQVDVHVTTVQNEDPRVLGNIIGRSIESQLAGVKR